MTAQAEHPLPRRAPESSSGHDDRIVLRGVDWSVYEALVAARGDERGPRMTYLEGTLELMSPSDDHEWIKKTLARLLEAYALERALPLEGYGAWTVKKKEKKRGLEPDECYVLGPSHKVRPIERPDIAIEVVWSHWGVDKLEVYRGLAVPEVWVWRNGALRAYRLEDEGYVEHERSALIPDLDLAMLASLVDRPSQTEAVQALLARLRGEGAAPADAKNV